MDRLPLVSADAGAALAERVADALCEAGACRIDGFLDADGAALAAEARRLAAAGALREAGVGTGIAHMTDRRVRGDRTLWLDDPACVAGAPLLARLHELMGGLRPALRLPLAEVEAHYAHYPVGTAYARHRDRFRDSGSRLLSWVGYLNPDWQAHEGGQLRIHFPSGDSVDVLPAFATSVCFLSELEHEVLPATRERYSIAAWMRRG